MSENVRAKYKIEVHFGKNRTTAGPNVFGLSAYESGSQLDGNGDEMMYICAETDSGLALGGRNGHDKEYKKGSGGCGAFIPGKLLRGGVAVCPNCGRTVNAELLTNTVLGNLTTEALSVKIAKWFRKLENNADIYLKYHPTDIRYAALVDAHGLDKGRMLRGLTIYPLKNIVKDTLAGASLEKRIKALLSA